MTVLFGIAVIAVAIVAFAIGLYNVLVQQRMHVTEARADVETLLKKRFDMVPNLVNTVKGYAKHEEGVFTKVAELRNQMNASGGDMEKMSEVNNQMTSTLKTLFAVAENYPELKADASFLQLQNELTDLETEIQKSRRFYNAVVGDYNTKIQVFPNVLIAGMMNFKAEPFFSASEEEQKNVKVEF